MFRMILLLIMVISFNTANAAVPTYSVWNDSVTVTFPLNTEVFNSINTYESYLQAISNSEDLGKQINSLTSLESFANSLCQLCSAKDKDNFQNYINQSNKILTAQFNIANDSIKKIQDFSGVVGSIITQLTSDPQLAALALQRSASEIQMNTQNTLTQMHIILLQQQHRDMVIIKQTENNLANMYTGLSNSGL